MAPQWCLGLVWMKTSWKLNCCHNGVRSRDPGGEHMGILHVEGCELLQQTVYNCGRVYFQKMLVMVSPIHMFCLQCDRMAHH